MHPTHAPALGLLVLDTRFPRLPGDVGHAATFPFPVLRRVIRGASPRRVVQEDDPALLAPFAEAARALVAEGAVAIATSCGFLASRQRELAAVVSVPVWSSSLLALAGELAGRRAGVITVDAASLGARHFAGVGADPATPVEGLAPGSSLQRTLLDDLPMLDADGAEREVVAAGRRLLARDPDLEAIVLECTNLPPYAEALRHATSLPVHDITTVVGTRWRKLVASST